MENLNRHKAKLHYRDLKKEAKETISEPGGYVTFSESRI
jgi:hypothetical protein